MFYRVVIIIVSEAFKQGDSYCVCVLSKAVKLGVWILVLVYHLKPLGKSDLVSRRVSPP